MSLSSIPSFVDGAPLQGSGQRFDNVNPATGQTLASVWEANAADVEAAVVSAQRGFEQWSTWTGTERGRVLRRAADLLRLRNRGGEADPDAPGVRGVTA